MEHTHWNHENSKLLTAQDQQDPENHLPTQLELAQQHCDAGALTLPTKQANRISCLSLSIQAQSNDLRLV